MLCLQLDEEIVEAEYRYDDLDDRRTEVTLGILFLVLTIFNEGAYLTFKSIFHKALNLFQFDCELMLESVP